MSNQRGVPFQNSLPSYVANIKMKIVSSDLTQPSKTSPADQTYPTSLPVSSGTACQLQNVTNPAVIFLRKGARHGQAVGTTKDTIRQQLDGGAVRKRLDGFKQQSSSMKARVQTIYNTHDEPLSLSDARDGAWLELAAMEQLVI
jgi:hypothetical protein